MGSQQSTTELCIKWSIEAKKVISKVLSRAFVNISVYLSTNRAPVRGGEQEFIRKTSWQKSSEREYNKSVTKAADKGRAAVTMKKWDYKNLKCISTSDVPAD